MRIPALIIISTAWLLGGCGKPAAEQAGGPGGGPPPERRVPVTTAKLVTGAITEYADLSGNLHFPDRVMLRCEVPGAVTEFALAEGSAVTEGQLLVQLDATDYKLAVAQLEAELLRAQRVLAELQTGTRPEVVARLQAEAAQAEALLQQAIDDDQRIAGLHAKGVRTDAELTRAKTARLAAEAALAQVQARVSEAKNGPTAAQLSVAEADIAVLNARLASSRHQIQKTTINSPCSGVVVAKHTELREFVSAGEVLLELVATNAIELEIEVPERFIAQVAPGLELRFAVDAVADRTYTAEVRAVMPIGDRRSRNFRVLATPTGDLDDLLDGMYARVKLPVARQDEALLAPLDAVTLREAERIVFAVEPDDSVRLVPVTLGLTNGERVEVIGELAAGDEVVTTGGEVLFPGAKIQRPGGADGKPAP